MPIQKYVGQRAEVVYLNANGRVVRRVVSFLAVTNKSAYVYDCGKQEYRTLGLRRILAVMPADKAS